MSAVRRTLLFTPFLPNFYSNLSHEHLALKIDAFEKYEAEHRDLPNPRNRDGIANIAINIGNKILLDFINFSLSFSTQVKVNREQLLNLHFCL